MAARLLEKYKNEIIPALAKSFSYKNKLQAPRLEKIVVNMGVGEAMQDIKILDKAMEELGAITGQKPVIRRAKKAISNFKTRQGLAVGCKVTLRRNIMYEFLDRFLNIALPRIRDFRGVAVDSFDKAGNYSIGITDQVIFPEIDYDKITRSQGMDITFVINARSVNEARELLKLFGMPFKTEKD